MIAGGLLGLFGLSQGACYDDEGNPITCGNSSNGLTIVNPAGTTSSICSDPSCLMTGTTPTLPQVAPYATVQGAGTIAGIPTGTLLLGGGLVLVFVLLLGRKR